MLVPWNQSAIMMMAYTVKYSRWKLRKIGAFSPCTLVFFPLSSSPLSLSLII